MIAIQVAHCIKASWAGLAIFLLCLLNLVGLFIWIAVEGEEDKTVPEQLFSMFN